MRDHPPYSQVQVSGMPKISRTSWEDDLPSHLSQNDRELLKTKIEIVGIFRYRSFRQESFDESPQHSR